MRISPGLTPEILRTAWGREGGRGRRGRGRGGRRRRRRRGRRGGRGGQGGVGEEKKGEMREYKQRRERWEWECENVTGGSATDIIPHRSGPILLLVVDVPDGFWRPAQLSSLRPRQSAHMSLQDRRIHISGPAKHNIQCRVRLCT